jgi:hypothetical protein
LIPVLEVHYLPSISYFSTIEKYGGCLIEQHEHYVKQTFRNRCYINTEHGKDVLIIPLTSKHGKAGIREVRIDYSQKWVNNHWRSIVSAYGKAPFFKYYSDDLQKVLYKRFEYLYDLNFELLTMCLKWLRSNSTIQETLSYEKNLREEYFDLRSRINPKKSDYVRSIYRSVPYHQVFGNSFVEDLSIIDLIFCCGPDASSIVRSSSV